MKKLNYQPVIIEWYDSSGWHNGRWTAIEEIHTKKDEIPIVCVSLGFLIQKTKSSVILARSLSFGKFDGGINEVAGVEQIPTACIQSIRYLKPTKELK